MRRSSINSDQYEIIAGERRFRAAKLAKLTVVPCLLTNYSDEQAAQIALIENTAREALNPIAEAIAIKRLSEAFHYTHEEIGALLGVTINVSAPFFRVAHSITRCSSFLF